PRGAAPMDLIVRRDGRPSRISYAGGTVWDGATLTKMLASVVSLVGGFSFFGCALLIIARPASLVEARWLALTLLCIALGQVWTSPYGGALLAVLFPLPVIPLAMLVGLSTRFGGRNAWRTAAQWSTYAAVATAIAMSAIGWYGWMTARFDPMPW